MAKQLADNYVVIMISQYITSEAQCSAFPPPLVVT